MNGNSTHVEHSMGVLHPPRCARLSSSPYKSQAVTNISQDQVPRRTRCAAAALCLLHSGQEQSYSWRWWDRAEISRWCSPGTRQILGRRGPRAAQAVRGRWTSLMKSRSTFLAWLCKLLGSWHAPRCHAWRWSQCCRTHLHLGVELTYWRAFFSLNQPAVILAEWSPLLPSDRHLLFVKIHHTQFLSFPIFGALLTFKCQNWIHLCGT